MSQFKLKIIMKSFSFKNFIIIYLALCALIMPLTIVFFSVQNEITYIGIMKTLYIERTQLKQQFFERNYTYIELVYWEHEHITFAHENNITRNTDPFQILSYGKGKCGEFAILYTAICMANGYEARLVVADVVGDHSWTEVKINDNWIHVDPSDKIFNQTNRYENKYYVHVLAYEDKIMDDVTLKYNPKIPTYFALLIPSLFICYCIYVIYKVTK